MTQISRPFQIALVAMVLLAAVWFVVLRGHSPGAESSSSASSASPSSSSSSTTSSPPGSSASTAEYHGSAPGVAGLTRAIAKARGAVAQSQQNAQQLQQKSAQASTSAPAAGAPATTSQTTAVVGAHGATVVHTQKTVAARPLGAKSAGKTAPASKGVTTAHSQASVEAELKQGKIVTILFWNPKASVDAKVHREVNALRHALGGKIAVHEALANQVGSFGTFTRTVQVYGTPTILIINKQGQTTSLTGLTDVFSLKQAIAEAKSAQ